MAQGRGRYRPQQTVAFRERTTDTPNCVQHLDCRMPLLVTAAAAIAALILSLAGAAQLTPETAKEPPEQGAPCVAVDVGASAGVALMQLGLRGRGGGVAENEPLLDVDYPSDAGNYLDRYEATLDLPAPFSPGAARLACTTRKDERAHAWFARTSPDGTPCLFGVDPRDEGHHCISIGEKFGSYGWCWTAEDHSAWGSCGEGCPLFGMTKRIGKQINEVGEMWGDVKTLINETRNASTVTPGPLVEAMPKIKGKGKSKGKGKDKDKEKGKEEKEEAKGKDKVKDKDKDTGKGKGQGKK